MIAPGMEFLFARKKYVITDIESMPKDDEGGHLHAHCIEENEIRTPGRFFFTKAHPEEKGFTIPDCLFLSTDINDLPDMKRTKLRPIHRILQAKSEDE